MNKHLYKTGKATYFLFEIIIPVTPNLQMWKLIFNLFPFFVKKSSYFPFFKLILRCAPCNMFLISKYNLKKLLVTFEKTCFVKEGKNAMPNWAIKLMEYMEISVKWRRRNPIYVEEILEKDEIEVRIYIMFRVVPEEDVSRSCC